MWNHTRGKSVNFLEIKILIICPKCGQEQSALRFQGCNWYHKCILCNYIFDPKEIDKYEKKRI